MTWTTTATDIMTGADVFGADGEKVGTVAAVYPGYIVVEKGFLFLTDYYVPMSAVASASSDRVVLTLSKDVALQSGWDAQPVDLETASYDPVMTGAYATDSAEIDDRVGEQPFTHDAHPDSTVHRHGDESIVVPVREEELTATVREQEAGAVRIEKDVVAEERTLEVPVTEERVRIERRVVDRPVTATEADAFQETVIDVPLTSEEVEVQKRARVAEEVVLSKEDVQRTEQVTGTVRREEVIVDEDASAMAVSESRSEQTI